MHGSVARRVSAHMPRLAAVCRSAPWRLNTHGRAYAATRVQVMMGFIKEWQDKLGVKIVCSQVR